MPERMWLKVSPLHSAGRPRRRAGRTRGAALVEARLRKTTARWSCRMGSRPQEVARGALSAALAVGCQARHPASRQRRNPPPSADSSSSNASSAGFSRGRPHSQPSRARARPGQPSACADASAGTVAVATAAAVGALAVGFAPAAAAVLGVSTFGRSPRLGTLRNLMTHTKRPTNVA